MMIRIAAGLLAASTMAIAIAAPASADVSIKLEEVASGLTHPLALVSPPDGSKRKFVIEQTGTVRIIDSDGTLLDEPFLDLRHKIIPLLADFDERGLLGLAFHPRYQENGKFYVAYSMRHNGKGDPGRQLWWSHQNIVAEYTVSKDDPNIANANSERVISAIDWPQFNHNGHWIGFGKDGMLYISTGDGGYANDWGIGHNVTQGNGQDLMDLHGKMLRLDVDNGDPYGIPQDNPFADRNDALPEIWAFGLRNPWRCSFDMGGSNELFCGDVQQNSFEEVSIISKGANLGWRKMEANKCFDYVQPNTHPASCEQAGLTMPVMEYKNCTALPQGCMGISITGGYVYRGQHKDWDGKYIFGDWSQSFSEMDGQIFIGSKGSDGKWSMEQATVSGMETVPYILAFGQDDAGEVYALTSISTGPVGGHDKIYRITPAQ